MTEERRAYQSPFDVTALVAILYTLGFLYLAGLLYYTPIPAANKDALLYLFGVLSGIELSIINFYFGGSKAVETTQRATEQRSAKAESVLQDIAKAAPLPATAVTPAPAQPDGTVPAAVANEVQPANGDKT